MRTLVQISDLHFGRVDPLLLDPLAAAVDAIGPDVVVVSGDLTQRARNAQFRAARAFLDRLPMPQVVVPGNHDVPLYDVVRRFVAPLARFRRYIERDPAPFFRDDQVAVLGINSARSLTFKGGRINHEQIETVRARFAGLDPAVIRVARHPPSVRAAARCRRGRPDRPRRAGDAGVRRSAASTCCCPGTCTAATRAAPRALSTSTTTPRWWCRPAPRVRPAAAARPMRST